jgi:hypothetical protein
MPGAVNLPMANSKRWKASRKIALHWFIVIAKHANWLPPP